MLKGLQAGFGDPLGATLLTELRARGVTLVRADLQRLTDPALIDALIRELLLAQIRPLLIIRPSQATLLPMNLRLDIELLNEPDLSGYTPQAYAAEVNDAWDVIGRQHQLWAGSVSNLTKRGLTWLAAVVPFLAVGIGITVHRYPKNGANMLAAQDGFRTRWQELSRLVEIVNPRPWGVSEFGYHTGPQKTGWWFWTRRWHWTDTQIAQFAAWEWEWWQDAGAQFAVWYQLNDGTGTDPIDRFGIRTAAGSWKPVAQTFRSA